MLFQHIVYVSYRVVSGKANQYEVIWFLRPARQRYQEFLVVGNGPSNPLSKQVENSRLESTIWDAGGVACG